MEGMKVIAIGKMTVFLISAKRSEEERKIVSVEARKS